MGSIHRSKYKYIYSVHNPQRASLHVKQMLKHDRLQDNVSVMQNTIIIITIQLPLEDSAFVTLQC